jgi:hypothetical protein
MSAHYIEHDAGAHHVYLHDGRGHRTRIGPRGGWPTPRKAIDYADALDRASGGATPIPDVPPRLGMDAVVPPEPRTRHRGSGRRKDRSL